MDKLSYSEFTKKMREFNRTHNYAKERISGVIVFTEDSFKGDYSLESRSYQVWSDSKAWIDGMGGYSIFGSSLDGTDTGVRLDWYLAEEKGGRDGWKVDYCYFLEG